MQVYEEQLSCGYWVKRLQIIKRCSKRKQLKCLGKGNRPKKAEQLTNSKEDDIFGTPSWPLMTPYSFAMR